MGLFKVLAWGGAIYAGYTLFAPGEAKDDEPAKGMDTPGDETVTPYRGHGVAISTTGSTEAANPWRWRIEDPDGEAIANAVGWSATEAAALDAGKVWIDQNLPDLPPKPGQEATGAPSGPACEEQLRDGGFDICLYRTATAWSYRATDTAGMAVATEGGFSTRGNAKVAAWRELAKRPTTVVETPVVRNGVVLAPDGKLTLDNLETWRGWATGPLAQAIGAGQTPVQMITGLLARAFPASNPFRIKANGDEITVVAQRVAGAGNDPGKIATAMFGPYTVSANV